MAAGWTQSLKQRAAIVGVVALAACVGGALLTGKDQFFRSYLIGYIFWLGIAFGCLAIQMIHALTGGRWGPPIRRAMFAASTTLPLLGVLFLPLLLGMESLYPWARPEAVSDAIIQKKVAYLNQPFFIGRAIFCLVGWSALAWLLVRRSIARGLDKPPNAKMRVVAGPGLLFCVLTMTVASIDWLMSLDPHWFSTMFAVIVMVGMLLSAMCFVIIVLLVDKTKRGEEVPIDPMHDLGNLVLVFVMLWAYVSYSQYLIIYSGNVAEFVPWYIERSEGGWQALGMSLIGLHFALPFFILMSRRSKRSPKVLGWLVVSILVMRLVEIFWITAPNFYGHHLHVHWMDVLAPIGVGGVWLAYFFHRFSNKELAPTA